MTVVTFTVYGVAAPAGSKKALPFAGKPGGRPIVVDDSKRSRPWKKTVAQVAGAAMSGKQLLEGPLELHVVFYAPRPKGQLGTGRNAGVVKQHAPSHPAVKPDVTKLLRAVEDAITGIVWRDDAQVVIQHAEKRYGEPARIVVAIAPVKPPTSAQAQLVA